MSTQDPESTPKVVNGDLLTSAISRQGSDPPPAHYQSEDPAGTSKTTTSSVANVPLTDQTTTTPSNGSNSTPTNHQPLPAGWERRVHADGRVYFIDHNTKTTHWRLPASAEDEQPLPEGWDVRTHSSGKLYYVNHKTRSTSWARPAANVQHELPSGWEVRISPAGRPYYVNHNLKKTQWEPPERPARAVDIANPDDVSNEPTTSQSLTLADPVSVKHVTPVYARRLTDRTIRLLRISADVRSDVVACSLTETSLDSAPPFEAISYHWGDASRKVDIICNGQYFSVTSNLHDILVQMRTEKKLGNFWADAICINQSDNVEKTSQVRIMREIYSLAASVLIWLGPEEPGDSDAFRLIRSVNDTLGFPKQKFKPRARTEQLSELSLPAFIDEAWVPVVNFLKKAWFSRIWTLQEFIVSRSHTFRLGPLELSEEHMLSFVLNSILFEQLGLVTSYRKLKPGFWPWLYRLEYRHDVEKCGTGHLSMFSLMFMTMQRSNATDPRDQVFALIGLARDGDLGMIDYTKTHEEVLTSVALRHFCVDGHPGAHIDGLLPLMAVSRADRLYGMPSWMHDYTTLPRFKPLDVRYLQGRYGDANASFNLRIGPRRLHIACRIIDEVKTILHAQVWTASPHAGDYSFSKDGHVINVSEPFKSFYESALKWMTDAQRLAEELAEYPPEPDDFMSIPSETLLRPNLPPKCRTASSVLWRVLMCDEDKGDCHFLADEYEASYSAWLAWLELVTNCAVDTDYVPGTIAERKQTRPQDFTDPRRWGPVYTNLPLPLPDVTLPAAPNGSDASTVAERDEMIDPRLRRTNMKAGAIDESLGDRLSRLSRLSLPFNLKCGEASAGRKFFATREGYMGWMPEHAQEGDQICVFDGLHLPFVIRSVAANSESSDHYRVVGATYVHGLMCGAARAMGKGVDKVITLV